MGRRNAKLVFEYHDFYCTHCGEKQLTLARRIGRLKEPLHLKSLWCPNCKKEYNHVEIRSKEEEEMFKYLYTTGFYKDKETLKLVHQKKK